MYTEYPFSTLNLRHFIFESSIEVCVFGTVIRKQEMEAKRRKEEEERKKQDEIDRKNAVRD